MSHVTQSNRIVLYCVIYTELCTMLYLAVFVFCAVLC